MAKLNDISPMPFGKFRDRPMQDVPASYFHYLWEHGLKDERGLNPVADYIEENLVALQKEYPDGIWSK